ncbi:hypothetical protein AW736_16775 [Termitidicoccus mucosus]|uniref:Uncharacterized protein n=2 Tax=Termitidicoccus mucosus TaxID=1184151 RepID=A0A178IFI6_9BACT|nr:hypothetical protein AW736_16775 [Opitutaceae bacterium TSB47]
MSANRRESKNNATKPPSRLHSHSSATRHRTLNSMSTHLFSRFSTVTNAAAPAIPPAVAPDARAFAEQLSSLYALSHRSDYVFGSPLGPFYHRAHSLHIPRFVYFGPNSHDESLRLAFHAGFESADLRGSLALLHLVEGLSRAPDLGQGLNLSFFPLVDVASLFHGATGRDLSRAAWSHSRAPEIDLLQKDARARGYHGFVRIETGRDFDGIGVRLRDHADEFISTTGVELVNSADFEPLSVRWEADADRDAPVLDGPLTIGDDLPFRAFELTLHVPDAWDSATYSEAVATVLKRFILHYRGHHAYGLHL